MYAYIDESGDHNLDMVTVDNNYNIFVLSLVLINKEAHQAIDDELKAIKRDIFGDENFVIHTNELTHPYGEDSDERNRIICNPKKRLDFYTKLNSFIDKSQMRACFAVIRKQFFREQYVTPADPYELSFENLLNRTLFFSKSDDIEIVAEHREEKFNKNLEAEFAKYSIKGTRFHSSEDIKRRVKSFCFKKKKDNITGLQIADLLANPVGRHFLGIKPKLIGNEVPYTLVRSKLAGNGVTSMTVLP